jgi:small subunit ribosomal protein S18
MATPNRKVFRYRTERVDFFDYKDVKTLQRFLNSYGKIESRKRNGFSMKQQRALATALKRARHLALLPFVIR